MTTTAIMIGNIFSLCAMISDSISGTRKKHSEIMAVQIVSQFFYGASSIVLKGYSSTAQNAVAVFRNFAAMKNVKSKVLEWALILAGVVLGIIFNNRGLLGWLPVIANLEYSISVFKLRNNEKALKLAFIINMIMYAVFSAVIMNYVGVLSCTVVAVTTAVSLIKAKKSEPENKTKKSVARRDDWKTVAMPEQHESFVLNRSFSDEEMDALRCGNIPQAMEDKWFWYMEGETLWAHRSWTGYCIYRIDFKEDNDHVVTVNRDPEQYKCTSIEEDIDSLNKLLDWWTRTPYDHYNEWLSETYDALKKTV